MPAHKYYCDYCDKQFYDTPASRKRHLQGISHQRAKKQWFDSFRDQESGSTQNGSRPPCTFFLRTGTCQYGSECRFEHPARNPAPSASAPPFGERRNANLPLRSIERTRIISGKLSDEGAPTFSSPTTRRGLSSSCSCRVGMSFLLVLGAEEMPDNERCCLVSVCYYRR